MGSCRCDSFMWDTTHWYMWHDSWDITHSKQGIYKYIDWRRWDMGTWWHDHSCEIHINESCLSVMSHETESCHILTSHVAYPRVMSHIKRVQKCVIYKTCLVRHDSFIHSFTIHSFMNECLCVYECLISLSFLSLSLLLLPSTLKLNPQTLNLNPKPPKAALTWPASNICAESKSLAWVGAAAQTKNSKNHFATQFSMLVTNQQ